MTWKAPSSIVEARAMLRKPGRRRVFRKSAVEGAAALIGPLAPGVEICGLTNGQFSLVDMIEHVLTETGPADVTVATWTMGIYDTERGFDFVENGLIRRIRFLIDPSMFSRRPDLAAVLVKGFGADSFRPVNVHAKFATVRGDALAVAIRSSMNLNPNNRIESFDISVDDDVCRFFETAVDDIFARVDAENRSQAHAVFRDLLDVETATSNRRPNPFIAAG